MKYHLKNGGLQRLCSTFCLLALLPVADLRSIAQSDSQLYTFTTLAGGGGYDTNRPGGAARFWYPAAVTVDGAGNVYVVDNGNDAISRVTPAGALTTFAGRPGSLGSANGTGSAARFYGPLGAAVDGAGNVYVADTGNHTIRKITPAGVVTTLAGQAGSSGAPNGTGAGARFNYPNGVAVDSAGNIYVADTANNTIRRVTPAGVVTTLAGLAGSSGSAEGTNTNARFNFPTALAVDSGTNIYVTDTSIHTIRKLTPLGNNWVVTTLAGVAGSSGSADGTNNAARFTEPNGLALDGAGNLYVADAGNSTIRKLTPAGTNWTVTTIAGLAGSAGSANGTNREARLNLPTGVAVDGADNVYVADLGNGTIRKMTLDGTNWVVTALAGTGGIYGNTEGTGIDARFNGPSGVAVDNANNVYVADQINHTIRKVTAAGVVTTLAGLAGYGGIADGAGSDARFRSPTGVAVDSVGNVYVADAWNCTIRKVTPAGVVTTLAGLPGVIGGDDGTNSDARFALPNGVAVDKAGNLYVADTLFCTIRKVTPVGTNWVVTTLAGLADSYGNQNGTGPSARFYIPTSVAVDSTGNVYVADTLNHLIRKVTSAGVVTTFAGGAGMVGTADGTGTVARFYAPTGVAVDSADNVYVADTYNNTIRKITPARVVTTLGGMPESIGTANGTGNAARFSNPAGLAVDGEGNVYVADFYFNTIRKGVPMPRLLAFGFFAGRFQFVLTGSGLPHPMLVIVEASTDLFSWQPIYTNGWADLANSAFRDAQTDVFTNRFYRVRVP
jgi:sugar lactone lactonase YvrE